MELYKWQRECLDAWEQNTYHGIVNVITGAGKTVMALAAVDRLRNCFPDLRVRIVVPTIPLAGQWKQALLERAETEEDLPGFFGGTRKDSSDRRFMIYIVNSARTALSRHIRADLAVGNHVLLICDECHHYQSRENRKIFDFLTPEMKASPLYCSLGLSATPFSDEQSEAYLQSVLGKEIYRYGFEKAERDTVISPFMVCQVSTSFLGEERKKYMDLSEKIRVVLKRLLKVYPYLKDLPQKAFLKEVSRLAADAEGSSNDPAAAFLTLCYQRKEISVLAQARIHCCLALLERRAEEDRTLVFCERIDQAENTARAIRQRFGVGSCGIYHSQMSREARVRNMSMFRDGSLRILVSCRCLDEGIDVPDANIAIVMSGSSVERQRIQRLGRVIRRSTGKDAACLYYIYVRESSENRTFLPGFREQRCFDLRYWPEEKDFSNDLYEYAARELLQATASAGADFRQSMELRRCMDEGLTRADFLLAPDVQLRNCRLAENRREKNYWITMNRLGKYFEMDKQEGDMTDHELRGTSG